MQDTLTFRPDLIEAVSLGNDSIRDSFSEFEKVIDAFFTYYYLPAANIAKPKLMLRESATAIEQVQAGIFYLQVLQGKRLAEQLQDLVYLLNNRRLISAALITRAIIEVTASLNYFSTEIRRMLQSGIRSDEEFQKLHDVFDLFIRGSRFDWKTWVGGTPDEKSTMCEAYAKKNAPKPEVEQRNILTMIDHMDRRLAQDGIGKAGQLQLIYAILCDIAHPSAGANVVQLANRPMKDHYHLSPGISDEFLRYYCLCTTIPAITTIASVAWQRLGELSTLAQSLQEKSVESP